MNMFKKIAALCALLSGAEGLQSESRLAVNQKISELASTMAEAMRAEGDQDITYAQIEESLKNHIGVRFIDSIAPHEDERPSIDDYLNLQGEDRLRAYYHKPHKHHHHHKHHKKHHQKAPMDMAPTMHAMPPRQSTFTQATTQGETSQLFSVPIDEVKAITMKVSTTFERDVLDSVTLKAFRKVIGYDTFESILKKDRNEAKDTDDHYNITVSMMVRRIPEPTAAPVADKYNGGESLAARLDKGFPYDDDGDITESTVSFKKGPPSAKTNIAVLNGENVTKESLKNLLVDKTAPVTQELIQTEVGNRDSLLGENITLGALKNLVTDKPAPITTKLAQIQARDSLLGENITLGALKNLVTDKPAPITTKLAQIQARDSLLGENITIGALKNLVVDKPAPITVKLAQMQNKDSLLGENITVGNLKNLVTDKPAPITVKLAQMQNKDSLLGENITVGNLKNLVTDKPAPITVKLAQIKNKDSLLGENITIGALKNLVVDKPAPITVKLAQISKRDPTLTVDGDTANGMVGDEEIHGPAAVGGSSIVFNKHDKKQQSN